MVFGELCELGIAGIGAVIGWWCSTPTRRDATQDSPAVADAAASNTTDSTSEIEYNKTAATSSSSPQDGSTRTSSHQKAQTPSTLAMKLRANQLDEDERTRMLGPDTYDKKAIQTPKSEIKQAKPNRAGYQQSRSRSEVSFILQGSSRTPKKPVTSNPIKVVHRRPAPAALGTSEEPKKDTSPVAKAPASEDSAPNAEPIEPIAESHEETVSGPCQEDQPLASTPAQSPSGTGDLACSTSVAESLSPPPKKSRRPSKPARRLKYYAKTLTSPPRRTPRSISVPLNDYLAAKMVKRAPNAFVWLRKKSIRNPENRRALRMRCRLPRMNSVAVKYEKMTLELGIEVGEPEVEVGELEMEVEESEMEVGEPAMEVEEPAMEVVESEEPSQPMDIDFDELMAELVPLFRTLRIGVGVKKPFLQHAEDLMLRNVLQRAVTAPETTIVDVAVPAPPQNTPEGMDVVKDEDVPRKATAEGMEIDQSGPSTLQMRNPTFASSLPTPVDNTNAPTNSSMAASMTPVRDVPKEMEVDRPEPAMLPVADQAMSDASYPPENSSPMPASQLAPTNPTPAANINSIFNFSSTLSQPTTPAAAPPVPQTPKLFTFNQPTTSAAAPPVPVTPNPFTFNQTGFQAAYPKGQTLGKPTHFNQPRPRGYRAAPSANAPALFDVKALQRDQGSTVSSSPDVAPLKVAAGPKSLSNASFNPQTAGQASNAATTQASSATRSVPGTSATGIAPPTNLPGLGATNLATAASTQQVQERSIPKLPAASKPVSGTSSAKSSASQPIANATNFSNAQNVQDKPPASAASPPAPDLTATSGKSPVTSASLNAATVVTPAMARAQHMARASSAVLDKQNRTGTYAKLSPEMQNIVDQSKVLPINPDGTVASLPPMAPHLQRQSVSSSLATKRAQLDELKDGPSRHLSKEKSIQLVTEWMRQTRQTAGSITQATTVNSSSDTKQSTAKWAKILSNATELERVRAIATGATNLLTYLQQAASDSGEHIVQEIASGANVTGGNDAIQSVLLDGQLEEVDTGKPNVFGRASDEFSALITYISSTKGTGSDAHTSQQVLNS